MNIYTRAGDKGNTSLLNGENVSKNDVRIHFAGEADELNSHLGLLKSGLSEGADKEFIRDIQVTLMKIMAHGSDISNERYFSFKNETEDLEREIDRLSEYIPERFELVLPGENEISAQIHIARSVARRAERCFVAAAGVYQLSPQAGVYLNRLSDYLYVLSRYAILKPIRRL